MAKQIFVIGILINILLLNSIKGYAQNTSSISHTYLFRNVNIITMLPSGGIINYGSILISNNKIESINGKIPKGVKIIEGKGKWLIPGLIDIHVHWLRMPILVKKHLHKNLTFHLIHKTS